MAKGYDPLAPQSLFMIYSVPRSDRNRDEGRSGRTAWCS